MRFPFTNLLPTLLTLSNLTRTRAAQQSTLLRSSLQRASALRSMPSFPLLASLFGTNTAEANKMTSYPDQRSEDEWRAVLSKEQFRVLREKGTEAPGTGAYDQHHPAAGVYACAACGAALYAAAHKFRSGCGWPAYFDSLPGAVARRADPSLGAPRTEIVCARCGGHLGHVFKGEGFPTPTDERHCVNSVSLRFAEGDEAVVKEGGEGAKKE